MKTLYELLPKTKTYEGEQVDWELVILGVLTAVTPIGYFILLITY